VATRGCGPSCSFDNGSGRRERLFRTAQAPVECTRYGRSGRRHAGDGELPAPCCGIAYLTHRCQRRYASGSAVWRARPNADDVGVGSVPIILLSGFFIGGVMVLQTGAQFVRFGQTSLTGDVVSLALVRELAPAITGLLTAGRCSSGMASELASMLVTEQVDAMRAMGTDPSRKLVTPRVLASLAMVPLLTAMMVFVGLLGGCVSSVFSLQLSEVEFWRRGIDILEFSDLMQGFSKAV